MSTTTSDFADIPPEILAAANLLHNHFSKLGVRRWQLLSVCSRDYAYQVERLERALDKLKSHLDKPNNAYLKLI